MRRLSKRGKGFSADSLPESALKRTEGSLDSAKKDSQDRKKEGRGEALTFSKRGVLCAAKKKKIHCYKTRVGKGREIGFAARRKLSFEGASSEKEGERTEPLSPGRFLL